jgi:hypothetical protein
MDTAAFTAAAISWQSAASKHHLVLQPGWTQAAMQM